MRLLWPGANTQGKKGASLGRVDGKFPATDTIKKNRVRQNTTFLLLFLFVLGGGREPDWGCRVFQGRCILKWVFWLGRGVVVKGNQQNNHVGVPIHSKHRATCQRSNLGQVPKLKRGNQTLGCSAGTPDDCKTISPAVQVRGRGERVGLAPGGIHYTSTRAIHVSYL